MQSIPLKCKCVNQSLVSTCGAFVSVFSHNFTKCRPGRVFTNLENLEFSGNRLSWGKLLTVGIVVARNKVGGCSGIYLFISLPSGIEALQRAVNCISKKKEKNCKTCDIFAE